MLLIGDLMTAMFFLGAFPFVKATHYFNLVDSCINTSYKGIKQTVFQFSFKDIENLIKASILFCISFFLLVVSIFLYGTGIPLIPKGYTQTETLTYKDLKEGYQSSTILPLKTDTVKNLLSEKDGVDLNDYIYDTVDYSVTEKYASIFNIADYILYGNPSNICDSYAVINKLTETLDYTGLVTKCYVSEIAVFKLGENYIPVHNTDEIFKGLDLTKPVKMHIVYDSSKKLSDNILKEYKIISAENV